MLEAIRLFKMNIRLQLGTIVVVLLLALLEKHAWLFWPALTAGCIASLLYVAKNKSFVGGWSTVAILLMIGVFYTLYMSILAIYQYLPQNP